jgi:LacI family transcriptional regulator
MADVAALAEVDISVVSRVINEDPKLNIREETRQRVLDIVRTSGYVPNPIARSLRTAKAGVLGLLIPDFGNPVYTAIIQGAEREASARGYLLMTGSLAEPGPGLGQYVSRLSQGRVDGLMVAGVDDASSSMRQLKSIDVPWLLLNRRTAGAKRYVIMDDAAAAGIAVQHLVAIGHSKIAHISGPLQIDTAARRRAGFISAIGTAGLTVREDWLPAGDYSADSGAQAMTTLLGIRNRPTAVFAANLLTAIGAAHAVRAAGLSVPVDISIVAVDDLPLVSHLDPPLTTVTMPLHQMGMTAVRLLLSTPADQPIKEIITGPLGLLVRESTAPPRANA